MLAAALALLAATPATAQSWTPAWTASMWAPGREAPAVANVTLRAAVKVGAGGRALRLRLSNEFGAVSLAIGAATVRGADGRSVRVTFAGKPNATIAAGAPLLSDAVALPVKAFEVIEVSLFLPERTTLTSLHDASGVPTLVSVPGDHSAEPGFAAASKMNDRPLLAGIEVESAKPRPVVVAFGDSITDNTGCANDVPVMCRWGDVLGVRLAKAGKPHVVVTQAISGNRVLASGWGPAALARFDRDVLALPGVSHVVLLEGINDIGNSGLSDSGKPAPTITAAMLIDGYRQLIARAHAHGIKVIGCTILPFKGAGYYAPEREAIRTAANAWIRTGGAFDAVVDFERVVADPADPAKLAADLQGGDNLHPDGRGETKMGEAVPLDLFR